MAPASQWKRRGNVMPRRGNLLPRTLPAANNHRASSMRDGNQITVPIGDDAPRVLTALGGGEVKDSPGLPLRESPREQGNKARDASRAGAPPDQGSKKHARHEAGGEGRGAPSWGRGAGNHSYRTSQKGVTARLGMQSPRADGAAALFRVVPRADGEAVSGKPRGRRARCSASVWFLELKPQPFLHSAPRGGGALALLYVLPLLAGGSSLRGDCMVLVRVARRLVLGTR